MIYGFPFLCFIYERVGGLCIRRQKYKFCLQLHRVVPIFSFLMVLGNISVYRYIYYIFMEYIGILLFILLGFRADTFIMFGIAFIAFYILGIYSCFFRLLWGWLNIYLLTLYIELFLLEFYWWVTGFIISGVGFSIYNSI